MQDSNEKRQFEGMPGVEEFRPKITADEVDAHGEKWNEHETDIETPQHRRENLNYQLDLLNAERERLNSKKQFCDRALSVLPGTDWKNRNRLEIKITEIDTQITNIDHQRKELIVERNGLLNDS